ncbi:Oligopeptide-binding protein oppA [Bacillus thuringiensis serovar israelensis ATCC 35646]|nr:Oligopeptide-binding protein oppA [Bacillus thuringiensis serovar israelensis ATCC 35646]
MKQKLFALPFVLILLIALAACSGEKDSSKQAGTSKSGLRKTEGRNDV